MGMYHVLNRGVEKRTVVLNDKDRLRFVHDLFVFNDERAAVHAALSRRYEEVRPRKLLVHIHAFCLMHNHYHLLLSEAVADGIPRFMKKLNMGYAKYFNEKYQRTGTLWQGKYKKKKIERDAHFLYIPYYIHLNPLDFSMPQWRKGEIKNVSKALQLLGAYRWSSHLDYSGIKNFPSVTTREFLSSAIGTKDRYEKEIRAIIQDPDRAPHSQSIE